MQAKDMSMHNADFFFKDMQNEYCRCTHHELKYTEKGCVFLFVDYIALAKVMKERGITKRELAREIGMSETTLNSAFSRKSKRTFDSDGIEMLSSVLEVPILSIVDRASLPKQELASLIAMDQQVLAHMYPGTDFAARFHAALGNLAETSEVSVLAIRQAFLIDCMNKLPERAQVQLLAFADTLVKSEQGRKEENS